MEYLLLATDKWHDDDVQPNIVVPYANDLTDGAVHRSMRLNLEMQGLQPRYERMGDVYAYDRLFRRLWAEGEPFVIVEHDNLPWPGAVQRLWECDRPWCANEYLMLGELRVSLGCTKFDPSRLGDCPLIGDPKPWNRMDWFVIDELTTRYSSSHLHEPAVAHLNYGHQRMVTSSVVRAAS